MRAVLLVAWLLSILAAHAIAAEGGALTVPAWRDVPSDEVRARLGGVVEAPRRGVWLATIDGVDTLFVNGTPVHGDGAGHGTARHPVLLQAGPNALMVAGTRSGWSISFVPPDADVFVAEVHAARARPAVDAAQPLLVAARLVNATVHTIRPVTLEAVLTVGTATYTSGTRLSALPPLAEAGVMLSFPIPAGRPQASLELGLDVQVADCDAVLSERTFSVRLRPPRNEPRPREVPFGHVAGRDVVLVTGTSGTAEEDEALLARARYDAQRWLGRPGRCVEIVRDVDVLRRPRGILDRPLVLYGDVRTNAVWGFVAGYFALAPRVSGPGR